MRTPIAGALLGAVVASSLVGTLGAPLIPEVARAQHVSFDVAQWLYTTPPLVAVLATPILGRLGDGSRRDLMLHGTLVAMMIGCVLAAVGPSFAWVLVGRALQGVGLAGLPLCVALAREHLRGAAQARAIVMLSVGAGIGSLGFTVTGLVAQVTDYRGAYWFGAAMTALALATSLIAIPRSRAGTRSVPLDLPGGALLGVGLLLVLLSVSRASAWGWTSAATLGLAVTGLALLATWVAVELRVEHPLIDLRLARHPALMVANLGGMTIMFGMYGGVSLINRYAQTPRESGYGLQASVLVCGLILGPMGATIIGVQPLTRRLWRRLGTTGVFPLGAATAALTYLGLAAIAHRTAIEMAAASALVGVAIGWTFAVIPTIVVAHVPHERTGSAMSLHQVLRSAGSAAGSAVSIAILSAFVPVGESYPSLRGYSVSFLVAAGACGLTALAALLVLSRDAAIGERAPGELAPTASTP